MADTSDIGGSYSQVNGSNFVIPPTSAPSNAPTNTGFSQTDTISAAELAASLAMLLSITPQTPILTPPNSNQQISTNGVIPVGVAILNLASQYHKICMNILDSWSESIKKIAQDAKEAEKSPAHLAKTETERQQRLGLVDSVKTYADKLEFEKNDGMLGTLTNALIIAGAFTGVAVATNVGGVLVAAIPQIGFAVGFAAKALMPVGQDVRGQLGLVGAWAMGALINYSVIDAVTGKQGDKPIDERLLADKYGEKMLKLLHSPQLNNFITAMLANKLENGKPLSDGRKEELSAVLKTVILASALAAVYKSKTGAITAQEFTDLATGKLTPEDGVERQLVEAIKEQIASMNIDERPQILKALGDYMDEDPKLKEFFNVGNAFDHVNDSLVSPQVKS